MSLSPAALVDQMSAETMAIAETTAVYLRENHAFLRRLSSELAWLREEERPAWVARDAAALLEQADRIETLMKMQVH